MLSDIHLRVDKLQLVLLRKVRKSFCELLIQVSVFLNKIWIEFSIPFYRSETARKFSHDGTGLGLSICQKIAHLNDCEIAVESKLEQGTTFIVKIPKTQPSSHTE